MIAASRIPCSADVHQLTDQAAAQVASRRQAAATGGLDLADLQQPVVRNQFQAPGLVHHAAYGIDVERRRVGREAIGAQGCHQPDHVPGLELMPGHVGDVAIVEPQAVGDVLQHVAHGQLAGRRQASEVVRQRVERKTGQNEVLCTRDERLVRSAPPASASAPRGMVPHSARPDDRRPPPDQDVPVPTVGREARGRPRA